MKHVIFSLFVSMIASSAIAQSWTHASDRATAPPSIAGTPTGGPNVGGFEIVCYQSEWSLYLFTGISPERSGSPSPATLIIDGQRFDTTFGLRPPSADEGLVITPPIIEALKSGNRVEITFPTGGTPYSATFGLRGSSRALGAVEAGCAYPTPITAPERFRSGVGDSSPEAVNLARSILSDDLAQMRLEANKPDIDVEAAWFVDLDDGWRFITATVGASNFHFGFNGYGTIVLAKPAGQDWQQVGPHAPSFWVAVDTQARSNGWPNLIYQSERGVNQPFVVWSWNGNEYVLLQRIDS